MASGMTEEEETPDPDYAAMTGSEFQAAVGADPRKWAVAFVQRMERMYADRGAASPLRTAGGREEVVAYVEDWFRDAMAAAAYALGRSHGEILAKRDGSG